MLCVVVLLSLNVGEFTQGRCLFVLSFSPLWTGFMVRILLLSSCSIPCRGDYTGEKRYSTLVLPSLNRFNVDYKKVIAFWNSCRGEYTGEEYNIKYSRSPLYETGILSTSFCTFMGYHLLGSFYVHFITINFMRTSASHQIHSGQGQIMTPILCIYIV